jgi:hypothetical protein
MVAGLMASGWQEVIWISQDGYLAIADTAVPAAKQFEALQASNEARVIDATKNGVPVVAVLTEADDDVPVEVQRDNEGRVVSLRLCWTTGVDELDESGEGQWYETAMLPLPKGSCVVWDPFHGDIENGAVIDVLPGDFAVEIFLTDSDCLGLRVSRKESTHGG